MENAAMDPPAKPESAKPRQRRWKWPRVGWTAVFVGMALALTGLWVRSYWWWDGIGYDSGNAGGYLDSVHGRLMLLFGQHPPEGRRGWETDTISVDNESLVTLK